MDNFMDVFSGDAFSMQSLTAAIQKFPNMYGLVGSLNLFQPKGVATTHAAIEIKNGVLNLIQSTPRGSTAPKNKSGKRDMRFFDIPHIALDDAIEPQDLQNVRAFGGMNLITPAAVLADKLIELANKHNITLEALRCSAITGKVLDADGTTILLDLFDSFSVDEITVFFDLDNADSDILGHALTVTGSQQDNLQGEIMTGTLALCDPGFWAKFIRHPKVLAAYNFFQAQQSTFLGMAPIAGNPQRDDMRNGFPFGGLFWREYRGHASIPQANGTTVDRPFVAANTCRFIPMGTQQSFFEYYAPANVLSAVNTIGQPRYARIKAEEDRIDIFTESNPLPICVRPKLLIKGSSAAS